MREPLKILIVDDNKDLAAMVSRGEFVRLKHDFIWRLPEVGRRSLREIFLTKLNRRKKGETAY